MTVYMTINYCSRGGIITHSVQERWEKTKYFCPHCGKKGMWVDMADGDYYDGQQYMCANCGGSMCHPSAMNTEDDADSQRFLAITNAEERRWE